MRFLYNLVFSVFSFSFLLNKLYFSQQYVKEVFASCNDTLQKKQFCYILSRHVNIFCFLLLYLYLQRIIVHSFFSSLFCSVWLLHMCFSTNAKYISLARTWFDFFFQTLCSSICLNVCRN